MLADPERRARYDRTGEIDQPQLGSLDASAIDIIAQKLGLIIHAEQDVTSMDVADLIERTVRDDIGQRKSSITGLKRAIERVTRLRDRVKRKANGEDNMLAKVLDWHEIVTRNNIQKNEESVRVMERALEMLRDYSFAEERPAPSDGVAMALHETLQALDQLAIALNAVQASAEMNPKDCAPSAFG